MANDDHFARLDFLGVGVHRPGDRLQLAKALLQNLDRLEHFQETQDGLIEDVAVEFNGGFSVFTGETGAGKSILVGAIGLLLGERASADMVRLVRARILLGSRNREMARIGSSALP